jgi:hypothetical protein
MPTGYTAGVADGSITDFRAFAMQLARGMGALVMMRDEPSGAPVRERFEPSDYYPKKLADLRAERDRLYAMSDDDAQVEADREYAKDQTAQARAKAEHGEQQARYDAMIAKAEAWTGAPEGIKEFALDQLREGRRFDCGREFTWYRNVEQMTGAEWRRDALAKVAKDIECHSVEEGKDRARTDGRNAWLAQLRASLGDPA